MTLGDSALMIDSDKRRKIFDQVRTKAEARGTPIDSDPEFLAWVELWIRGEFDISSLKSRYDKLVLHRAQRKREPAASVQEISNSFLPAAETDQDVVDDVGEDRPSSSGASDC
jgi:hypothetical protein